MFVYCVVLEMIVLNASNTLTPERKHWTHCIRHRDVFWRLCSSLSNKISPHDHSSQKENKHGVTAANGPRGRSLPHIRLQKHSIRRLASTTSSHRPSHAQIFQKSAVCMNPKHCNLMKEVCNMKYDTSEHVVLHTHHLWASHHKNTHHLRSVSSQVNKRLLEL